VKKVLKNENAPKNIQILYKEIAEIIFYSAMGTYSKSKDVKKLSY
jgi:sRNA-binding carbon storage regulator CsrA